MRSERTQAIVLRRTNYGEADRILQLLTPLGRRSVMARGVRKEKSKLAGGVELFSVSDVVIGQGRGELGVLTSARLVHFYHHILEDYDRMQFGYTAIKLIASASEMLDEAEWFDALLEVLMGLDSRSVALELTEIWFYLQYTNLLGYELGLYRDVDGQLIEQGSRYRYDVSEKGFRRAASGELTTDHIKLMRLASNRPLKVLVQIGGIQSILSECLQVARAHAAV